MARRFDVLAVGEINVDLILAGLPRVPQFGTEVLASAMSMHLGGATANFSVFARRRLAVRRGDYGPLGGLTRSSDSKSAAPDTDPIERFRLNSPPAFCCTSSALLHPVLVPSPHAKAIL